VPTFTVVVALRAEWPLDDAAVAAWAEAVRPGDEEFSLWRDADEGSLLRISTDCSAEDLEAALDHGHALAEQMLRSSRVPASVEEVQVMTDEEVLVWRAQP
jgi:hypothetical protein